MNTYGYVEGNPLYWIDPYGLEKNYQAQRGWSSVYPASFNTQKNPFPKKPETIAEAVVQYGPYVVGGVAGLGLKQGVKQCAKKLADNKDLCKNAALASLLGISMCQQGKVPKGIGRFNKHKEFVTETTKPLRKPRESIVQPNR